MKSNKVFLCILLSIVLFSIFAFTVLRLKNRQSDVEIELKVERDNLSLGFSDNAVNTNIFRKNSVTNYIDENENIHIFTSYYSDNNELIVAHKINNDYWEYGQVYDIPFVEDAHNSVSIMCDGQGYVHLAYSDHDGGLSYFISDSPCSIVLKRETLIGDDEDKTTYPEFYKKPSGDLFLLYRYGSSGNARVVLNGYDVETHEWNRIHSSLIDGNEMESPYWQACVDKDGKMHFSWLWRESSDVATNHDMHYIVSVDQSGSEFVNSENELMSLPVTPSDDRTRILTINKNAGLINQTSMTVNNEDEPVIASYWRTGNVIQYHIVYRAHNGKWIDYDTQIRDTDFDLSGGGTKAIPCARPEILSRDNNLYLITRDEENDSRIVLYEFEFVDGVIQTDYHYYLTSNSVGTWEPTYDKELFRDTGELILFVQYCGFKEDIDINKIEERKESLIEHSQVYLLRTKMEKRK